VAARCADIRIAVDPDFPGHWNNRLRQPDTCIHRSPAAIADYRFIGRIPHRRPHRDSHRKGDSRRRITAVAVASAFAGCKSHGSRSAGPAVAVESHRNRSRSPQAQSAGRSRSRSAVAGAVYAVAHSQAQSAVSTRKGHGCWDILGLSACTACGCSQTRQQFTQDALTPNTRYYYGAF